ncbi:MAG: hypothetical protein MMC33_004052 [Icmadophila ericetorum]|nr:hypothetical protein [Icmadophila ericetorum]
MFFNIGLGIAFLIGVARHAVGYPLATPRISILGEPGVYTPQYTVILQIEYAMFAMQTLSLAFAKLSVLMFYRRLFVTGAGRDWFDVISLLMLVMCTLWGAGFFLSTIFNCGRHFSDYWKPGQVHCLPYDSRPLGYSISDFLTDFTILCMPMGIVWNLHLKTRKKLIVTALFLVGAIAVIASLVRMAIFIIFLVKPAQEQKVDIILYYSVLFFWTIVESSASIIAACLPSLQLVPVSRKFIFRFRKMLLLNSLHSSHSQIQSKDGWRGSRKQSGQELGKRLDMEQRTLDIDASERGVRTYREMLEMEPWEASVGGHGSGGGEIPSPNSDEEKGKIGRVVSFL